MAKVTTAQRNVLVATIAANLNTDDINPTFKFENGNVAKASKWFDEARNREMFSIGYYEEGLGVSKTDEFALFEELIAAMKALADGDLSLWEIADSTSAVMGDEDEDDFSISDLEYKIDDRVVAEKILQSPKDGNVVIKVGALGTIKQLRKSYAPYGVAFDDVDGLFYVSDLDIGLWEISEE